MLQLGSGSAQEMAAHSNDNRLEIIIIKTTAFHGRQRGVELPYRTKKRGVTLQRNRFWSGLFLNCSHLLGLINYE